MRLAALSSGHLFAQDSGDPLELCADELLKMHHLRLRQVVDALTLPAAVASAICASAAVENASSPLVVLCTRRPVSELMAVVLEDELRQRHLLIEMMRAQRTAIFAAFATGLEQRVAALSEERRRREADEGERRALLEARYRQSLAHLRGARKDGGSPK